MTAERYPRPQFVEPVQDEYLYAGWTVDPPSHAPLVRTSARRKEFLDRCRQAVPDITSVDGVIDVRLLEAVLMPPLEGLPRHDVVMLVRASTAAVLRQVRDSERWRGLGADFQMAARNTHRMGDTERIGDTERNRSATFLLNHFVAADAGTALTAFERITGWYTAKVGVDNFTLLQPTGDAPYVFVNYVRLPGGPVGFMLAQLSKPSFHRYVRGTLKANGMTALPVLFKLA